MVSNQGRQIQFINGINGITPGGNATINFPTNVRYHRNKLQCVAINYTGGTALPVVKITGAGTGATATPTVVNGVVTSVAVVAGGAGFVTGDTVTLTDATGTGLVLTVTAAAGAITAFAVTSTGTPSPVNPVTLITAIQQVVNGVNVRDINPDQILRIIGANGTRSRLGELPLLYTEPFANVNQLNELLSWDMAGQSTFDYRISISPLVTTPGVTGVMEFDSIRNARPTPQGLVPFLQPVAQHALTFNLVAGLNNINTIPFDYPIRRMWLLGSVPGNIVQFDVEQDGVKILQAVLEQEREMYQDYGFEFGQANFFNVNYATSNALKAQYNPPIYFDAAYISDPDQRTQKALNCERSLVLRVTSAVQQSLTVVIEYLPGQYAA